MTGLFLQVQRLLRIGCTLLLFVSAGQVTGAEQASEASDEATTSVQAESEQSIPVVKETAGSTRPDKDKAAADPGTGAENRNENLRVRDLGEAFRTFQPSEAISADNAVPFPVDI